MNTGNEKLPEVVRVQDVARALGCHDQTVRRMVRVGDLPAPRRIGRGRPFWTRQDLAGVPLELPHIKVIGRPVTVIPGAPDSPVPMISKAA